MNEDTIIDVRLSTHIIDTFSVAFAKHIFLSFRRIYKVFIKKFIIRDKLLLCLNITIYKRKNYVHTRNKWKKGRNLCFDIRML